MTPQDALAQVKEAAYRARLKWPDKDDDGQKASRAIAAFEKGYVALIPHYGRDNTLCILDPNKKVKGKRGLPTMFNCSERHIRRVVNIRTKPALACAALESAAMKGALSMEVVEWFVNHPPSGDTLEAIWLAADPKAQAEFLARIKR
jgi:hypothetical protein